MVQLSQRHVLHQRAPRKTHVRQSKLTNGGHGGLDHERILHLHETSRNSSHTMTSGCFFREVWWTGCGKLKASRVGREDTPGRSELATKANAVTRGDLSNTTKGHESLDSGISFLPSHLSGNGLRHTERWIGHNVRAFPFQVSIGYRQLTMQ